MKGRRTLPPATWIAALLLVPFSWWVGGWVFGIVPLWVFPIILFALPPLVRWQGLPKASAVLLAVLLLGFVPSLPCESRPYSDAIPLGGFPDWAPERETPLVVGASGTAWIEGEMEGERVRCPAWVFGVGLVWLAGLAGLSLWMQRPEPAPPSPHNVAPRADRHR